MKVTQTAGISLALLVLSGGVLLQSMAGGNTETPVLAVAWTRSKQPHTNVNPHLASPSATSTEVALAPENNPPGDIPDSQVFISYSPSDRTYQLKVPEGWARQTSGTGVSFIDNFDGVQVTVSNQATVLTAATAKAQVEAIKTSGRAVTIGTVKDVSLPGGSAVRVVYTSNSEPNAVTGRQIRLENNAYLFFHNGKMVMLRLWAPEGADNVDQWQSMSQSFRWL